ncbi:two-component response regulator ARR1 [Prunus yedoensis var. nudiflora]|uniref:Two-component response regulator ARR1 n=1 Tax=Prunus yedoensis var. nudiflora TaxID=2094558 RepID=A0A314UJ44_PRUYE|nr:two-component response regulator ARR1 [Prunus yedoensis var. nudiflora]
MSDEKAVSIESVNSSSPRLEAVSVLVVDGDSACLAILSRMLYNLGYKVMTAKRAYDALSIAQKKEDELHLVLTEAHLPDMDKYELLEKMKAVSKVPVVIMSDDDDENAMLGGLFKGAVFYFVKPLTINSLKNLWQFAFIKNRNHVVIDLTEEESSVYGESQQENTSNEGLESESFMTRDRWLKRKNPEGTYKDEETENSDSTSQKKPKLVWTNELHKRFLQAVRLLGVDSAHPKNILQHMNVPGLRKENVSSHLQKYRLSLKQEQEAIMKARARGPKKSFPITPIFINIKFSRRRSQTSNRYSTSTAYQPKRRSHVQDLSSHMITSNKELAGFRQVGSFVRYRNFDGNKNFSTFGDHGHSYLVDFPIFLHNSTQQEATAAATSTTGSVFTTIASAFSAAQPQEQQENDILGQEATSTTVSAITTIANAFIITSAPAAEQQGEQDDIFGLEKQLMLSPQWHMPSMPSMPAAPTAHEQEKDDILGIESEETDDLFDIAKGTTQHFNDIDFDDLW